MPTLLATKKMSPELRARIQVSVSGRRATGHARLAPRAIMVIRLAALLAVVGSLCWFGLITRRVNRTFLTAQSALLQRWQSEASAFGPGKTDLLGRVEPWLRRETENLAEDWIADDIQKAGGLAAVLSRPTVYIRGPEHSFVNRVGIEALARETAVDALAFCLVEPPKERKEKLLRSRARAAYARGPAMTEATAHVHRLGAAVIGMPLLQPEWRARVMDAKDLRRLEQLKLAFEKAPLASAKAAVNASLLLYAIDEPGDAGSAAELDGEKPHYVKVGVIDLIENKPLLRLRRRVDPSWLSDATRIELAHDVDSCTLAWDVHQAVKAPALSGHRDE